MATDTRPLLCFYDGSDYVIAFNEADADALYQEHTGGAHDGESEWEIRSGDKLLSFSENPDSGDEPWTQTIDEWIAERGRGWFCSENY